MTNEYSSTSDANSYLTDTQDTNVMSMGSVDSRRVSESLEGTGSSLDPVDEGITEGV